MLAPFGIRPKGTLTARMLPLAVELQRKGHSVQIIAPSYLNPADAYTIRAYHGVVVEHVRLPRFGGPFAILETATLLLAATLRFSPDVLHLFKPKGYSGIAALFGKAVRPRLPLVVDTDDWEGWGGWNDLADYSRPMKSFFAWQERTLPHQAAAVTVASRTLQSQMWGFGVRPERVWYVPNGVSPVPPSLPDRYQARQLLQLGDEPIVLLYTRFWEYALQDIVAVLLALQTHHCHARLLVIGAGERGEEHELARLAERAGVSARLDQRGWAEQSTIDAALAAADVALAPFSDTLMNRSKGMAKLLQLLHAGIPTIASRVGQAAEYIVDGQSGLLVPPDNGGALAQAVLELLANSERARVLGDYGQRHVLGTFSWPKLATSLEEVYSSVHTSGHA